MYMYPKYHVYIYIYIYYNIFYFAYNIIFYQYLYSILRSEDAEKLLGCHHWS